MNIFKKKNCRKWGGEASSRPLCVFKKPLEKVKAKGQHNIFWWLSTWRYNKTNWITVLLIKRYAQFWYFRKDFGNPSPSHLAYDFSRKMFLTLYSINWWNFIIWLSLLLEMLDNMCIAIVCFPGCDAINFEITVSF